MKKELSLVQEFREVAHSFIQNDLTEFHFSEKNQQIIEDSLVKTYQKRVISLDERGMIFYIHELISKIFIQTLKRHANKTLESVFVTPYLKLYQKNLQKKKISENDFTYEQFLKIVVSLYFKKQLKSEIVLKKLDEIFY